MREKMTIEAPWSVWATADQQEVDLLAVSLLDHPDVAAARSRALEAFRGSSEFGVADAPAGIDAAVDNLLFSCLQYAANDNPADPKIVWTVRLPYEVRDRTIPDSRYGADSPDRVYRVSGVGPEHRYEITGRRHPTHPSLDDLSLEALPDPGLYGRPMVALQREQIDIDPDGRFTITADSSPANGRRNHLELPVGTRSLVIRDTLLDWRRQIPNEVSIRCIDGPELPERSFDEIAAGGVKTFEQCVTMTLAFLQNSLRAVPANALFAFQRPVQWGKAGGLFGVSRFELGDDEALCLTLDQVNAGYVTIVACDPWSTSIAYDCRVSCLNNVQAQANDDGTFTFVVSPADPGVFNWLDTAGLRTGAIAVRWELFDEPPAAVPSSDVASDGQWAPGVNVVPAAVRDVSVMKVHEVAERVPSGQAAVGPEERARLVDRRRAEYQVRVTGQPITTADQEND